MNSENVPIRCYEILLRDCDVMPVLVNGLNAGDVRCLIESLESLPIGGSLMITAVSYTQEELDELDEIES